MPAYEYVCKDCSDLFTVFLSLKEFDAAPRIRCPHCGSDNTVRQISGFFVKTSRKS